MGKTVNTQIPCLYFHWQYDDYTGKASHDN